jgi:tetratricopeptide (TPR) repeat protein
VSLSLGAIFLCLCLPSPAVPQSDDEKEVERAHQVWKKGNAGQAIEILNQVATRSPSCVHALVERGDILFAEKHWTSALAADKKLLQMEPRNQHLNIVMGICQQQLKNLEEAARMLDKAISVGGPETAWAHKARAMVFIDQGETDMARSEVMKAVKLHSGAPDADDKVYLKAASDAAQRISQFGLGPNLSPELQSLAAMAKEGKSEDCLTILDGIGKGKKWEPRLWALKGSILTEAMEYDRAMRELVQAVNSPATKQRAYFMIGRCQFNMGKFPAAIQALDHAIAAPGVETGLVHREKADVLLKMGRAKEARAEIDQALKLHPEAGSLRFDDLTDRVAIDMVIKDYNAAVDDANKKIAIFHGKLTFPWRERGDAYLQLGQLEKAKNDFLTALKITPGNREAMVGLVKTYEKLGDKQRAEEMKLRMKAMDGSE